MVHRLPDGVALTIDEYLHAIDDTAPGLVEGLHLYGSVVLDDHQPGISDVDLVAVCSASLPPEKLDAVEGVHRTLGPGIDVVYATSDDLRRNPLELSLPGHEAGEFHREAAFAANPVVWRTLATKGIALRGDRLTEDDVWFDADALGAWNLANLDSYWADWVTWARDQEGTEARVRFEYGLQWLVLGVPRLHCTIATLDVISKTAAGHYAKRVAPRQWHAVLDTAIALRADRGAPLNVAPDELWRDAIDLSAWLIEDAHRVAGGS